ncbi:MAG: hypothetical protein ACI959_001522 [Limisphaerales bacterium]|jgi:hypothetical protein
MFLNLTKIAAVIILLMGGTAFAQLPEIPVEEKPMNMVMGEQNGYEVIIVGGEAKDVAGQMKKTFREYKGKTSGNFKEELFFEGLIIKSVSDSTINMHVRMFDVAEDTKVMVFFDLWDGFLSSEKHPDQSQIASDILAHFGLQYQKILVERHLKEEMKNAKTLERELNGLITDKEKMHKSVNESERVIERLRVDISENELDQERKRAQIEAQKDVITKIQGGLGDEVNEADKTLNNLEKELNRLEKEHERMHGKIENNESSIKDTERKVEKNLLGQTEKTAEIKAQGEVIIGVKTHLEEFPNFKK